MCIRDSRQPVFADYPAELPVTDHLADHMLSLPMHSQLTERELEDIADTLERLVANR